MSAKLMANPMEKNRQSFRFSSLDHSSKISKSEVDPKLNRTYPHGVFLGGGAGVEPAWFHLR